MEVRQSASEVSLSVADSGDEYEALLIYLEHFRPKGWRGRRRVRALHRTLLHESVERFVNPAEDQLPLLLQGNDAQLAINAMSSFVEGFRRRPVFPPSDDLELVEYAHYVLGVAETPPSL
jgi:hypothetical protein